MTDELPEADEIIVIDDSLFAQLEIPGWETTLDRPRLFP
jgi:hypothetical protein